MLWEEQGQGRGEALRPGAVCALNLDMGPVQGGLPIPPLLSSYGWGHLSVGKGKQALGQSHNSVLTCRCLILAGNAGAVLGRLVLLVLVCTE